MKLNTTREERDAYVTNRDRYPLFNDKELAEDCNTLEDELARVRERLEAAEKALAATLQPVSYVVNGVHMSPEEYKRRFGGRDHE